MASVTSRTTNKGPRYDVRYRTPSGAARSKTFRTRREADSFARSIEVDKDRGAWTDARQGRRTFGDVAIEWLASNPAKKPSSLARDELVLESQLPDDFTARPIGQIRPSEVQAVVNGWNERLAASSVNRGYGVIRAVCTMAYERDIIAKSPCRGIHLPRIDSKPRPVVSPDDLARLSHALGPANGLIALLGTVLGLRWGEVCGLKVGDLDLLRRRLTVNGTLSRDKRGATIYGTPKSQAGKRTLSMPEALSDLLASHLTSRGLTAADAGSFLFVTKAGSPHNPNNWRSRVWLPAVKVAGLEGLQFHDLRRTNATALVTAGVDAKTTQTRLGHSDPRLTLALYAQTVEASDRAAADQLGKDLMGGSRNERATDSG